jgi:hypothetical protein
MKLTKSQKNALEVVKTAIKVWRHNNSQWIDYRFIKVALTDKGEAYLAGALSACRSPNVPV